MSQAELASRVGISQPRLSALELHPASIRVDQLLALCAALGLELAVQEKAGADAAPSAQVEW
jgi:HTH-type transcriptional regulator / antitoxin HipB